LTLKIKALFLWNFGNHLWDCTVSYLTQQHSYYGITCEYFERLALYIFCRRVWTTSKGLCLHRIYIHTLSGIRTKTLHASCTGPQMD
jgi:hypothetical protein